MRKSLKVGLTVASFAVVVILLIWGFLEGRHEATLEQERERPVKPPLRVSNIHGQLIITLDSVGITYAAIQLDSVRHSTERVRVRAFGTVVDLQPLAQLVGEDRKAVLELEKATAQATVSRQELDRLTTLHRVPGQISDKDLQIAEATWRVDTANVNLACTQLQTLESTANQEWGHVIWGWITSDAASLHQLLERREFLILVTVPSGTELPKASTVTYAHPHDNSLEELQFVSDAPTSDPRVQGANYFYRSESHWSLAPGTNLKVLLTSTSSVSGVIVPTSAVVWVQGVPCVYVETGLGQFVRQAMFNAVPTKDGWFVGEDQRLSGRIAVAGAQLLLSEELRSQIQVGEEGKSE